MLKTKRPAYCRKSWFSERKIGCKIFSIEIFFFSHKISVLREKKIPLRKIPTRIFAYPGEGNLPLYYYIATFFFFFQKSPTPKSLYRNFRSRRFREKKGGGAYYFCYWLAPLFENPLDFFRLDPGPEKIEWRFRQLHKGCLFSR